MKVLGAGGWGLAVVVMGLLAPPLAGAQSADDTVRKQLAGEWTLVKYEVFPENGPARPGNYDVGRINYGEREMSAHLMRTDRPAEAQIISATSVRTPSTRPTRPPSPTSSDRRCARGSAPSRCGTTGSHATAAS